MSAQNIGKIVQVIGPVVDIEFPEGKLPNILNAIFITNPTIDDQPDNLVVEVAQHLGNNVVRCIAMDTTDGLVRGMEAKDTGKPIMVPVGKASLGRILNVVGRPVDNKGPVITRTPSISLSSLNTSASSSATPYTNTTSITSFSPSCFP